MVGFVTVHDDEVEQMYVDEAARGSGVADVLLRHAETVIGRRSPTAWLAVVAGNARARRFYARNGWCDTGPFDNPARTGDPHTPTITVPSLRYEKQLRPTEPEEDR